MSALDWAIQRPLEIARSRAAIAGKAVAQPLLTRSVFTWSSGMTMRSDMVWSEVLSAAQNTSGVVIIAAHASGTTDTMFCDHLLLAQGAAGAESVVGTMGSLGAYAVAQPVTPIVIPAGQRVSAWAYRSATSYNLTVYITYGKLVP